MFLFASHAGANHSRPRCGAWILRRSRWLFNRLGTSSSIQYNLRGHTTFFWLQTRAFKNDDACMIQQEDHVIIVFLRSLHYKPLYYVHVFINMNKIVHYRIPNIHTTKKIKDILMSDVIFHIWSSIVLIFIAWWKLCILYVLIWYLGVGKTNLLISMSVYVLLIFSADMSTVDLIIVMVGLRGGNVNR